jgi:transcriptional regulator with XRE-family HTH domain
MSLAGCFCLRDVVEGGRMPLKDKTLAPNPTEIRQSFALSRERVSPVLGVSAKTWERWENSQSQPNREQMQALAKLREIAELGRLVYTEVGFQEFLKTPLDVFGGLSALQLLSIQQYDKVLQALTADYEGLGY